MSFFDDLQEMYLGLSGSILLYYDPVESTINHESAALAATLTRFGIQSRELMSKWHRVVRDLAHTFYSICHHLELSEKANQPRMSQNDVSTITHQPEHSTSIPFDDPLQSESEFDSETDNGSSDGDSAEEESSGEETFEELPNLVRQSDFSTRPRREIRLPSRMSE